MASVVTTASASACRTDETSYCIEKCLNPGERSTCRAGYTCGVLTSGGVPIPEGACFPDCSAPSWECEMGSDLQHDHRPVRVG